MLVSIYMSPPVLTFNSCDSVNILKIYHAIAQHLDRFPQDSHRFPGFFRRQKTVLVLGEDLPLEGELHSAGYFHGRYWKQFMYIRPYLTDPWITVGTA